MADKANGRRQSVFSETAYPPSTHQPSQPAQRATHPGVPLAIYQEVLQELELTRQQLQQVLVEKQRMASQQVELEQVATELYSVLANKIAQLQRIQAVTAPPPGMMPPPNSAAPASYEFLDRLKQRQQPFPPQNTAETSYGGIPSLEELQRSSPSQSAPPFESTYAPPRGRSAPPRPDSRRPSTRNSYSSEMGYTSRSGKFDSPKKESAEEADLFAGLAEEAPDYPSGLYQRAREQHSNSQPLALWIIAALLLVLGSFGAGFLVVQPFVREADPPSVAPPTESP
ncbi:MAG: hypothetical protein NW237_07945 [Cyanobacteriota bacterium]|nr:hypothetical protein [Cyanobacteriota bacterium]